VHGLIVVAVTLAVMGIHAQRPAAATAIRLYVLDGGTLKERDGVPYGLSLEQTPPRDLSDFCALIVHPNGLFLWDTGLNESVNDVTSSTEPPAPGRPRPGDHVGHTLRAQLATIGYKPSDIRYAALSHSHWDHTGNVQDFLGATWFLQKREYDLMFGERRPSNFDDFAGLQNAKTVLIEGDYDVFKDGTVRLLFTPGHTAGHQSLLVQLPKTGAVIVSGDLYHFPEELALKPTVTGRNSEQIKASMARVQALIAQTGAQLWIQHDIRGFAKLGKSPTYYE
jgi:glyoxylase-like metal-dependent hydrolase (beta-lactamase superfamily II)